MILSRSWRDWKETLVIVKPETVLRLHRKRFASYWTRLYREGRQTARRCSAVDIATMSDFHYEDGRLSIVDRIHDTEVALTNAVLIVAGEFLTAGRARVCGQLTDSANHPCAVLAR